MIIVALVFCCKRQKWVEEEIAWPTKHRDKVDSVYPLTSTHANLPNSYSSVPYGQTTPHVATHHNVAALPHADPNEYCMTAVRVQASSGNQPHHWSSNDHLIVPDAYNQSCGAADAQYYAGAIAEPPLVRRNPTGSYSVGNSASETAQSHHPLPLPGPSISRVVGPPGQLNNEQLNLLKTLHELDIPPAEMAVISMERMRAGQDPFNGATEGVIQGDMVKEPPRYDFKQ